MKSRKGENENAKGEEGIKKRKNFKVFACVSLHIHSPRCSPPTPPSDYVRKLDKYANKDENYIANNKMSQPITLEWWKIYFKSCIDNKEEQKNNPQS